MNTAAETVKPKDDKAPKLGKPGRKPKSADTSSDRYFIGDLKDGIPVIQKEVPLMEAIQESSKTGRPFISVKLWKTKSEMRGDEVITVKTPL
jgi:hypothetical protein